MVRIRISGPLRRFCAGSDTVEVEGTDLGEALDKLEAAHPGTKSMLCDDGGDLRRFVNIFVDSVDIRGLRGLDTALHSDAEVVIVSAIAGG